VPSCPTTLPLHDALPICAGGSQPGALGLPRPPRLGCGPWPVAEPSPRPVVLRPAPRLPGVFVIGGMVHGPTCRTGQDPLTLVPRSEEHTSELQSRENLVC